jgi:proliferating cell nuclear antigen
MAAFEVRVSAAKMLRKLIESIKDFIIDANLNVSPTAMSISAMDSNHVALADMSLTAKDFELYNVKRSSVVGINLESVSKILKCAGDDDSLTLQHEAGGDSLIFLFEKPSGTRPSRFALRQLDIDQDSLAAPPLDYTTVVSMSSAELQLVVRQMVSIGSEHVVMESGNDGVQFKGVAGMGDATIAMKDVEFSIHKPTATLTFSAKYLNYFMKAAPLAERVTLKLRDDTPLQVEYLLGGQGSYLRFHLPPVIVMDPL